MPLDTFELWSSKVEIYNLCQLLLSMALEAFTTKWTHHELFLPANILSTCLIYTLVTVTLIKWYDIEKKMLWLKEMSGKIKALEMSIHSRVEALHEFMIPWLVPNMFCFGK